MHKDLREELMKGKRVFVVIDDDFYKATVHGPELTLGFILMSSDEVIDEVRRRTMKESGYEED